MNSILSDKREIKTITFAGPKYVYISVKERVTKIEPYKESDGSLWFAIHEEWGVSSRVNGRFIDNVMYSED